MRRSLTGLGVQILTDETEQHCVLPGAVLEVRLPLHALAHVAAPLGLRDRALVEAVDLQLDAVQVEVDEQVTLEHARRLVGEAAAAVARMNREPSCLRDAMALVQQPEADRT